MQANKSTVNTVNTIFLVENAWMLRLSVKKAGLIVAKAIQPAIVNMEAMGNANVANHQVERSFV